MTQKCTASLTGPDSLLTAAQCLYNHKYGWAESVSFFPSSSPSSSYGAIAMVVPSEWPKDFKVDGGYNIGMVLLEADALQQGLGYYEISADQNDLQVMEGKMVQHGLNHDLLTGRHVVRSQVFTSFPQEPHTGYHYRRGLGAGSAGGPLVMQSKATIT